MPYTRATFRVTRNGQPEEGWQPIGLTLADACGNRWTPELFPDSGTRGEVTCVFRGELWPDEPAWKLRATLHRMDHFTPEELWTVVGVEAPRPGTVVRSKITARRQGASLRLLGIVGQGALMSGGSLTTIPSVESCATVQVREEGSVKGLRVNLFRATDERGRSVTRTFTFTDGKVHVFGMNALPPVKRLNLTFSVHRTHTVEFVVKPAYP
jgi:hypothetical protein